MLSTISSILDWAKQHGWLLGIAIGLTLLTVVAAFAVVPWFVVRIPADYFVHHRRPKAPRTKLQVIFRLALKVFRNVLGVGLLLTGMAMLFVPGPGIITLLVGLMITDLPGKRRMERWIITRPHVCATINKVRAKHHLPPIMHPKSH